MVTAGRSMAQATKAGNYFQITLRDAPDELGRRRKLRTYDPPACESLDEVIECFLNLFGPIGKGMTAEGARVAGGQIGSRILDSVCDVTDRLQPNGTPEYHRGLRQDEQPVIEQEETEGLQ